MNTIINMTIMITNTRDITAIITDIKLLDGPSSLDAIVGRSVVLAVGIVFKGVVLCGIGGVVLCGVGGVVLCGVGAMLCGRGEVLTGTGVGLMDREEIIEVVVVGDIVLVIVEVIDCKQSKVAVK